MELSFSTAEVREICEKRQAAIDAIGAATAAELAERLADIEAVGTAAELAGLFSDTIEQRSPTEFALLLNSGRRLVMRSGHAKTPMTDSGATDWEKVTRVKIVTIEAGNV